MYPYKSTHGTDGEVNGARSDGVARSV